MCNTAPTNICESPIMLVVPTEICAQLEINSQIYYLSKEIKVQIVCMFLTWEIITAKSEKLHVRRVPCMPDLHKSKFHGILVETGYNVQQV